MYTLKMLSKTINPVKMLSLLRSMPTSISIFGRANWAAPFLSQSNQEQGVINKRHFSSETNTPPSPIYELRMYETLPKDFKSLMDVNNEFMDLRRKHNKLVGFWTAEIGGVIQQVVHLWEFESLEHRREVRKAITADTVLIEKFLSKVMPLNTVMRNQIVIPVPQTQLDLDFTNDPNAVYVLQTIHKASKQKGVPVSKVADEKLVGRLMSVIGPANTEFRLFRYIDINSVTQASVIRATETRFMGSSLLMYPAPFSPIQ